MKLKNALENISKSHEEDKLNILYTPWGEHLDPEHVWEEYPRPQMRRDHYQTLNGYWEYRFTKIDTPIIPGTPFVPDGEILVPFSPESLLSGVNRQLKPDEYLWYQRLITLQKPNPPLSRCLLHFDAVDQEADVYINGLHVAYHMGGYLPFSVELPIIFTKSVETESIPNTDSAKSPGADAPNANLTFLIQVRVRDVSDTSYHTRGKQTLKRGGMFYTAQSGIWQCVWYEWVPDHYVTAMRLTPNFDLRTCELQLTSTQPFTNITVTDDKGRLYPILSCCPENFCAATDAGSATAAHAALQAPYHNTKLIFRLPETADFYPWTPDTPHLYPLQIQADKDLIHSYFAMRSFTVEKDDQGIARFCLNHKPLFLHGLLDQGYWPEGLMTAPCDEAFVYDIKLAKSLGFNMLRKHIKIEPLRWYYHCDRLGMIVWQDMVNGGTKYNMPYVCYLPTLLPWAGRHLTDHHYRLLARSDKEGREEWLTECAETIRHLYNVPSLAVWVPFNEAWGQFDAAKVCELIKNEDATRPVDATSGWFDQGCGDFRSIHNYFRRLKAEPESNRACVISEYGGYACHIPGHSSVDRIYGYQKYDNCKELQEAYDKLITRQLIPLEKAGLSGGVYTQLSDIEEEVNGVVSYDRQVVKLITNNPG